MRKSLLDILACPKCKSDLVLEIFEEKNDDIVSGKLICKKCNTVYPIEDGIPNLLPQL
ncbi:MAG: methytransferase partner Trm112 [Archaeoglobaceae archaeon]|nr:methytransferase partner Trm112 [Archaeoglobaceae archaeon]